MSPINEEVMKTISVKIFEVAKTYPGNIEVKHMKERMTKSEITQSFGHQFEAEYSIDDPAIVEKVKDIAKRGYRNHVWVMMNPFDMKYELYSY